MSTVKNMVDNLIDVIYRSYRWYLIKKILIIEYPLASVVVPNWDWEVSSKGTVVPRKMSILCACYLGKAV